MIYTFYKNSLRTKFRLFFFLRRGGRGQKWYSLLVWFTVCWLSTLALIIPGTKIDTVKLS